MQSLGRVGRILSGSLEPNTMTLNKEQSQTTESNGSTVNDVTNLPNTVNTIQKTKAEDSHSQNSNLSLTMIKEHTILQEPDVIASTKLAHSKTTDSVG